MDRDALHAEVLDLVAFWRSLRETGALPIGDVPMARITEREVRRTELALTCMLELSKIDVELQATFTATMDGIESSLRAMKAP